MGLAKEIKRYTPAEYYELERKAEYKSDYYDGEIFPCGELRADGTPLAMAGGSVRHSLICVNLSRELSTRLKGRPCIVLESNVRVKVQSTGLRTYPDVGVYCGQREYDPDDSSGQTLTNPTVLFEVLSPTTESYDRTVKGSHFRRMDSLKALVLVAQDKAYVEVYQRLPNGEWSFHEFQGMDEVVRLPDIGTELPMSDVYLNVDFTSDR